jgi:hypothetical protein
MLRIFGNQSFTGVCGKKRVRGNVQRRHSDVDRRYLTIKLQYSKKKIAPGAF